MKIATARDRTCLLALFGLVALFFAELVAFRGVLFLGDVGNYTSRLAFTGEWLQKGRLPLWNPWLSLGGPHAGDPISPLFYPLHPLLAVLLGSDLYGLDAVIHVFIAAWGTFALARRLRMSRTASALSAIAYAFGGFAFGHLQHLNVLVGLAWIPVLLAATERYLAAPSRRSLGLAAAALGLLALGGHVQITLYGLLAWAAFALRGSLERWRPEGARGLFVRLGGLGAALLLGLALAGVFLLPFGEWLRFVARPARMPTEEALTYSFPPSRLATLVAPFWLGGSVERPHYWVLLVEASCYLGMLPLALALVGLARPTRCSLFLLGFGLVAFALAMGEDSPLYLLVLSIPVIGWVRAPARFLALGVLSAALLAGQGLDALQAARARRWAGLVAAGLVFVALGVALAAWRGERTVLFLPKRRDPLGLGQWDTLVLLLTLAGAAALLALLARRGPRSRTLAVLCLAFAAGDLFGMKSRLPFNALADPPFDARSASASGIRRDGGEGRFYTFIEKEPWRGHERRRYLDGYRRLMWDSLRNSLPMRKGLQSLTGLQNEPPVHARLVQAVSGRGRMDRRAARLLGAYGIRYVISATPATAPELVLVSRDLLSVYRNELATPRAHLVPERRIAADAEGAFALVKRPDFDAFRTVVLESASGEEPRLPAGAAAVGVGRASILRDEPDRVVIGTSSGRPGWLVLNDTFAPGWRAEVDGRTRPILRANGLVRAVEVGAGRHRVEFVYAPDSVRRGAALSLVGLLATSVLLLGRTSRPPRPEPGALDAA